MHLLGVRLDVLLVLGAKRSLLALPCAESPVWRSSAQRSHREAYTRGGEEEREKKKKNNTNHTASPLVFFIRVSSRTIRQRINLKVNVG